MKFILIMILLLFADFVYGQQHNGTPANSDAGTTIIIWVKANGKDVDASNVDNIDDDFLFYISAEKGSIKASFGTADENGNETIESFYENISGSMFMPDNPLILYMDFMDFSAKVGDNPDELTVRVKVFNRKTGENAELVYLAGTGWTAEDYEFIEVGVASGPTLAVTPLNVGCWSDGETFDLADAVTVSGDDEGNAVVKYYTDATCGTEISSVMTMGTDVSNPSTVAEGKHSYWAKIDGDTNDKAQEIEVTIYPKPEVSLAVDEGETVCEGNTITLKTSGSDAILGEQSYTYYKGNDRLPDSNKGNTYSFTINESATYFVYVNTVKNCKDTAHVDVTVTPVIKGDVKIAVADNKTAICNGESVELTVSIENKDKYPGTITYAWSTGETTESITVSPNTTTTYNVHATLNGCTSDVSVDSRGITVKQLPTFTPVNPDPVCSGVSNTVNITQSGTGNDYHYYSNEGLTSEVADETKVAAGEYWVTLTENGCTSLPQKVTATVNPSPTPKILVNGAELTGSLCAGTEITLTAEKTYSSNYTWTNVTSGASAAQAKATIAEGSNSYGLTVSENGCEGTATLTVTGLKVPTATIADISGVCADSEVSLEATPVWSTGAGGSGVWTYSGAELTSTTEGSKIVAKTNVPEGKNVYTLKLTDKNGCEATKDVEVGGKKLSLAALTVNPQSVEVGNSVYAQVSASWNDGTSNSGTPISGPNYTRVWKKIVSGTETELSGTDVNLTDYPNVNGTVYRVIAEKEGCRDTLDSKPVEVQTKPFKFPDNDPSKAIASVDNRFDVCYGDDISANPVKLYVTVQGGSEEYTYTWKYPSTMTATANGDTLTITAIDYENFGKQQQISVEISDGVETISADRYFSVRPIPQITINDKNGGATVQACKKVALMLTAAIQGGGGNFTWASGAKEASIAASTSTVGTSTYQVTAEYGGCSNTDSVKVQVNELPKLTLAAQVDGQAVDSVCPGTEIKLVAAVDGADSPTFKWLQGASSLSGTQPTIAVNSTTIYGVECKDGTTTCISTASVKVGVYEKVQLVIGVLPASQVCPGTEVTMTITEGDADTYVWASSDGDMSDVKGDTYTVTPTGKVTYTVNGKDKHGCEATSVSATLEVRPAPTLVLAQSTLHGCAGQSVDMRNAVKSLGSATLKVKNAAGDVLEGTSVTEAGTYTLYIYGGSCSSNEETVEVQFHALPTVTLTADKISVCLGEEVALSAEGAGGTTLDYTPHQSWRDTPTSSGEASYTVTVKNEYGCSATATTSVTVKPLPEVTIEDPGTVCAGAEVTLRATGADSYAWTGGAQDGTGETYKVTPTGTVKTYSVIGTKDGCQSDPVSRTLDVQKVPELPAARRLEACVGTPIDLKSAFDAGSYTLTFYNKDKGAMAVTSIAEVKLSDTLFYAKATVTQGNCSSEFVPVRVYPKALPQFNISGVRAICQGDETTLTVEGNASTYTWSPAGKDNATSGAQMVVNPTTDTEYTVTAKGQNACTAESKWRIVVNSLPKLKWNSGIETALIKGQSATWFVQLETSSTSPYNYVWKHNGEVDKNYTSTNYTLTGVTNPEVLAVKVVDANTCSDSLEISIPVTTLDELAIAVETDLAEGEELCKGNIAHLQVVTTKGALTSGATYKWTPADGLDLDTVANPVFTATTAGTHTYTVTVTEQGETFTATVDLVVKNFDAPVIDWDPSNPTSFITGEGFVMNTVVTSPTIKPYHYTWLKPANGLDSPQYSVQTPNQNAYDFAVVMKDGNDCRTTDTLTAHLAVVGADAIEIEAEDVTVCAVPSGEDDMVSLTVKVTSGQTAVNYQWSAIDHSLAIEDSNTPEAKVNIAGVPGGSVFGFKIVVSSGNSSQEKIVNLSIDALPSVEIDEKCVALYQDSAFVLNVVDMQDYSYTWTESKYDAGNEIWGVDVEKSDSEKLEGRMEEQDMRYILTAKTTTGCQASDTAFVWRIPDAPTVTIDTNLTKLDIKLTWDEVTAVDGYTVWSRKWDPYCLMSEDAAYTAEPSITTTEWVETEMDTLEFYYVTADKNVCGTSYHSLTSDTVGYKYDMIAKHPDTEKTSNSHIAWLFDMSNVGIVNASDVLKAMGDDNCVIRAWEQQEQDWLLHQTLKNPLYGIPGFELATEYTDDFMLQVGEVYQFDSPGGDNEFLQYGKLPVKFAQTLSSSDKGTNTIGCLPLHHSYCIVGEDLLRKLEGHVEVIRKWDWNEQDWLIQILKNPLFGIPGFDASEYVSGDEILLPGMVLQIDISELPQYIWE